jgi:hypothetical protein
MYPKGCGGSSPLDRTISRQNPFLEVASFPEELPTVYKVSVRQASTGCLNYKGVRGGFDYLFDPTKPTFNPGFDRVQELRPHGEFADRFEALGLVPPEHLSPGFVSRVSDARKRLVKMTDTMRRFGSSRADE